MGLCRVKQKYGVNPIEQICSLSAVCSLYPWEMMHAGEYLANGGNIEDIPSMSVEGMLDEK